MKIFHSIMPTFTLAFDFICILLAGYMTWKQMDIYFQNEDFSEISFQSFTDGTAYNYPTYTICLEDNNLRQIYQSVSVKTKKDCPEDKHSTFPLCPNGCNVKEENRKLIIFNKTKENRCIEQNQFSTISDDAPMHGFAFSFLKDDPMTHSLNYDSPDAANKPALDNLGAEIENAKNEQLTQLFRKKRSFSIHEIPDNGVHFDLECTTRECWQDGSDMIVVNIRNKVHIIGAEQYQLLLMGHERNFSYQYTTLDGTSRTDKILYDTSDVLGFDFNKAVVNMSNLMVDMKIEMENGLTVGWSTDEYKNKTTHCVLDVVDDISSNLALGYCHSPVSFKSDFEKRDDIPYPLERTYQDPTRTCYSPKFNPTSFRTDDQLVFDLKKMLHDMEGEFKGFKKMEKIWRNSMIKIYIHMQGQFIRGIGRPAAELTAKDLSQYCLEAPQSHALWNLGMHDLCFGTQISFDVSQVTLLRSRHDAMNTCDSDLKDEDSKILKTLIKDKRLSCVPSYWKSFEFSNGLPECNNTWQYKYISEVTSNFTNFGKAGKMGSIRKRFDPPCEEMIIGANYRREKGRVFESIDLNHNGFVDENENALYLDLIIKNTNPTFQIIKNGKSFTMEGCWAGIGGFIGIFIGISLMQVPELITRLLQLVQKAMK